jgi:hypothetical protein
MLKECDKKNMLNAIRVGPGFTYSSSSITITSLEFEPDPVSFDPDSALTRFSRLPESSCGPSRFRLRSADGGRSSFELSSLSDSMIIVSPGVSATLGVEVCED